MRPYFDENSSNKREFRDILRFPVQNIKKDNLEKMRIIYSKYDPVRKVAKFNASNHVIK